MVTRMDSRHRHAVRRCSRIAQVSTRTRSSSSPATTALTRKAVPIQSSSTAPARSKGTNDRFTTAGSEFPASSAGPARSRPAPRAICPGPSGTSCPPPPSWLVSTRPKPSTALSIVPTILGRGEQPRHDFMYWEFHEGRSSKQAVRMGDWKAVRVWKQPLSLYNLASDIAEANDWPPRNRTLSERSKPT